MKRLADIGAFIVCAFDRLGQQMLPLLMALIVLDVVGRRFLASPTVAIQELQWHAHGVLFLFCVAATYLDDAHVRVDVLRERFSPRLLRGIEVAGVLLFLLPYVAVNLYFSLDLALASFASGERSSAAEGLGARWLIKSALPLAFALLAIAGLVTIVRVLAAPHPEREAQP